MKRQGGVNEPKVIAKEKVYSEADNKIEHKEKVNEGQKPYEQLKVDNTAKANDKTETKIGKKEAPMEMQGEEIEPKEVKKDDSDVEIKLVVQQKENFNEDKKPSEQLKVDHKPEEQTDSAAKEKKVKMVKKKKKKAKTDSNDEIKFDELISEPQQVSYT